MSEQTNHPPSHQEDKKSQTILSRNLVTRIVSAIFLGIFTLGLTYHSVEAFLCLMALTLVLMVWEWSKLTNNDTPLQLTILGMTIAICLIAFLTKEAPLFWAAFIGGSFLAVWSTHYWWRAKWALLGIVYIGLPILCMIYFRDDADFGFYAILYILFVVWGTDSAAYFAGRHFGGKKLAPSISPSKTWSGSMGGLFAGLIIGALIAISISADPIILGLIGVVLSAISQIGDLTESAIKRHFGVKDSGALIPGHGGIFDRLDGVIFAVVAAACIAYLHNHQTPAKALLLWSH